MHSSSLRTPASAGGSLLENWQMHGLFRAAQIRRGRALVELYGGSRRSGERGDDSFVGHGFCAGIRVWSDLRGDSGGSGVGRATSDIQK